MINVMMKADVKSKLTFYLADGTSEVEYCDLYPSNCSELIQNQSYRRRVVPPMEGDEPEIWRVINLDHVVKYSVQAYSFPTEPVEPPTEGGTV